MVDALYKKLSIQSPVETEENREELNEDRPSKLYNL
jgi:hypothetical protein